jgi:membrane protein YdbS with pleckstrin-like domain
MGVNSNFEKNRVLSILKPDIFIRIFLSIVFAIIVWGSFSEIDIQWLNKYTACISITAFFALWITYIISYRKYKKYSKEIELLFDEIGEQK